MLIAIGAMMTALPQEPARAATLHWRPEPEEVRRRFAISEPWDELVLSWNADLEPGAAVRFIAQPEFEDGTTGRYDLGTWTAEREGPNARTSVNGQDDDGARVETDILVLKKPAKGVWIEVVPFRKTTKLRLITVSLADSKRDPKAAPAPDIAPLDVPQKAQRNYPNGGVICSPTCVSMVLGYWAKARNRPEWAVDVPAVADGTYDPGWNGTGNWSFNAAFAGSLPGMTAYATRLNSVDELYDFLKKGVPVVASVSYALLKGRPSREANDGHLVVLVGAQKDGHLIFNDPGIREVRTTYPLDAFMRAWSASGGTVYLIGPSDALGV